jgi:hypothetical protein
MQAMRQVARETYRAVKLRSLATAAFDNVVHADVGTGNLLLFATTRASDGSIAAVTVTVIGGVAIEIREAPMRACATALHSRTST